MTRLLFPGTACAGALVFVCGVSHAEPPPTSHDAPSAPQESPPAKPGAQTLRQPELGAQPPPLVPPENTPAARFGSSGQADVVSGGEPLQRRWYGWQTLISDGIGLGLLATGASIESSTGEALGITGLSIYALGGPVIHGAHARFGTAFGSLGLRVGLPFLGIVVGGETGSCSSGDSWSCGFEGAAVGLFIGAIGASALDAALLSYDEVPERPNRQATARLRVTPIVAPQSGRYGLGLVGNF